MEISQCVACVHINNQNKRTLPLVCPLALEGGMPLPCLSLNRSVLRNTDVVNTFSEYILGRYKHLEGDIPLIEMVFRSRWEMDSEWADEKYIAEMEKRWDELYVNEKIRPYLLLMAAY